MRILVLSVNYWPEETGIGPLTTWRCEYLASRGHDVTVCTTLPYYPEWRVSVSYKHALWRRELHNGVRILRSWSWIPKRVTSAKRMVFETTFLMGNLMTALSAGRPDLLLVESPPLGLALTAALLRRLWGIPFVYDVMDLQPDAAADLGMLGDGMLMRSLYWLEKFAYDRATLVSTLTEG
ncbi:MAG: glycosyltransferase, partial [Candidatus Sulfotelmatobacter sp.]